MKNGKLPVIFQGFQKLIDSKILNKSNQSFTEKYLCKNLGKMHATSTAAVDPQHLKVEVAG